ncbi:hypothetical protein [Amycolatopsis sp. RTGN1]|uniref:hypothetical protein n=1 Tax=Amycolatopsis ponsaeliensis TaxID=2992142 RepID=UPI00254CD515|nr:hypothetical protein [Amycolatopsis sp. RTGN1]
MTAIGNIATPATSRAPPAVTAPLSKFGSSTVRIRSGRAGSVTTVTWSPAE